MKRKPKFFRNLKANIVQTIGSLCLLLLAAAIGIYIGFDKTNSEDKYVNQAFEYFAEANWVALYSYAEVVDNDFINEYFFEQFVGSTYGEYDADELSIGDVTVDGDSMVAEFVSTSTGKQQAWELNFAKKYENNYLFFPQWRLDISDDIIKSCEIRVPSGFTAYIDGVVLTSDNTDIVEEEQWVVYTIPRIFKGEHDIFLEHDKLDLAETKVVWDEDGESYKLDTATLQLEQSGIDTIKADAQSIVVGMYSAMFADSGTGEIADYFLRDDATQAMLTAVYDGMRAAINPEDGATLTSMNVTAFNHDEILYTYPNSVDVKVSFECTFAAKGGRGEGGGVRESYEGTTDSDITMHFVLSGDEWYCDKLDMVCIDYSKQEEVEIETEE